MLKLRSKFAARGHALRVGAAIASGVIVTMASAIASTPAFAGPVPIDSSAPANADRTPLWDPSDLALQKPKRAAASKSSGKTVVRSAARKSGKKLGGHAATTEPKRSKGKRVKVAALGNSYAPSDIAKPSVTGAGVRWVASGGCLDAGLKSLIYLVAANYGPVTVNSTCRSRGHNRAVGGARRSKHLTGDAVDFRVRGNVRAVYAYLRSASGVGGFKHYGGGLFHIDNGPRRTW